MRVLTESAEDRELVERAVADADDRAAAARIIRAVRAVTHVPVAYIIKPGREYYSVEARMMCYWLARNHYGWTWARIARAFHRASHDTVIRGVDRFATRMYCVPVLAEKTKRAQRIMEEEQ